MATRTYSSHDYSGYFAWGILFSLLLHYGLLFMLSHAPANTNTEEPPLMVSYTEDPALLSQKKTKQIVSSNQAKETDTPNENSLLSDKNAATEQKKGK